MSNNLEERFETAVEEVNKLPNKPQQEDILKLYGLYKRATVGVCNIEKPWAVQIEASLKWNAWKAPLSMPVESQLSDQRCCFSTISRYRNEAMMKLKSTMMISG